MANIIIPDGGTIGSTSDTDAITIASDGNVTVSQSIKATAIKHTNGTTAITINSDGSLSGKFEGAVKFVSNYKASGNPTDTNKVRIAYGVEASYHETTTSGRFMGFGFGQPVAIQSHDGSSWSWLYVNTSNTAIGAGQISGSNSGAPTGSNFTQQGFTYTIEMDKV